MLNPFAEMWSSFWRDLEKKPGVVLTKEQKERIRTDIEKTLNYVPKIGFFGKTGVGKSSLCNALFGKPICPVSDIESCTRKPQEVLVDLGKNQGITLLDIPGVGETCDRDEEYASLYRQLLPEIDCVFWLLKSDDRAYTTDELFYKNIVKPHLDQGKPLIFVLNQCDRIHPLQEWNEKDGLPGPTQQANLKAKIRIVGQNFGYPEKKIIAVSANERYHLTELVDLLIDVLPEEKRLPTANTVASENLSAGAKEKATNSFLNYLTKTVTASMDMATAALNATADITKTIFQAAQDTLFGFWKNSIWGQPKSANKEK